ncbi:copper chaperone CopZ [Bacillus sp. FSL K6-3431]|uniref:copper chaperone CopZ n=1 Tax=Bacillus sp. FSL K6-3431 TaxID=2921500 RepID=UPI0030F81EAF
MQTVTLNVEGMSCGHCVKSIEDSVSKLQGVSSVKVNLENGLVDVAFNKGEVGVDAIKEKIVDQGYDVK